MKTFRTVIALALFLSTTLFAKVIETNRMVEILSEVTADSLVVFDLDNTVMEAGQTLGSDQWFDYRVKQLTDAGATLEEALRRTSGDWEAINYKGRMQLVEEVTPRIVRALQDEGIPTMGLTARPVTFLEESLRQLDRLGLPFHRHTITQEVVSIPGTSTALFKRGLMSVTGGHKGALLLALLEQVGYTPGRVVFVDDKLKNVVHVDEALEGASIPSFAFRYGAADPKVAAFDAKLADFALRYFSRHGVVLSDEEARKLMGQTARVRPMPGAHFPASVRFIGLPADGVNVGRPDA